MMYEVMIFIAGMLMPEVLRVVTAYAGWLIRKIERQE